MNINNGNENLSEQNKENAPEYWYRFGAGLRLWPTSWKGNVLFGVLVVGGILVFLITGLFTEVKNYKEVAVFIYAVLIALPVMYSKTGP